MEANRLTALLSRAADAEPGAAAEFFRELLAATVFTALERGRTAPAVSPIVGEKPLAELGYMIVHYQGNQALPIFTEPEFVEQWADEELPVHPLPFRELVQWVPQGMWLYVNPGQEVGKEFTPWEIEGLRQGVDAIPDLVAALDEHSEVEEFVINTSRDLFPDFKEQLRPILEIYPELREAFLVTMQEGDQGLPKPVLGIRYEGIPEAKRIYLRSEFERASEEFLPPESQLMIVEDLQNPTSPNHRLFEEATPFYFAPGAAEAQAPEGIVQRLKGLLRRKSADSH